MPRPLLRRLVGLLVLSALAGLAACDNDGGLTVQHAPPVVAITVPVEGESFEEGAPITFEALVSDDHDLPNALAVTWSSDRDGPLDTTPADGDGYARFTTGALSYGNHVVTITVLNSEARSAEDFVTVVVTAEEQGPEITLRRPRFTDTGVEGVAFDFEALVRDGQDEAPALAVWFTSDLDGTFCEPTPDLDGLAACTTTLSAGDHLLTVGVRDSDGNEASTDLPFLVLDADLSDEDLDGYKETEGDCDDADPSVHPGATEYANGVDDDCDGAIDEGTSDVDDDGDGFSEATGDCDDGDIDTFPGALEVCDGVDNDCDLAIDDGTSCVDDDGDGYTETEGDCDDTATSVYPGAPELADAADNDCDGIADEGTERYDDDGDCFCEAGVCTGSVAVCGAVADGDCDDAASGTSPAAAEVCDSADNDCNGTADEATATDAATWYRDADGDFYGTASGTTRSCTQPSGYVANTDDCDDAEAATSPVGVELCDGIDNNCDGTVDEASATDAPTWYRDADADGYGTLSSTTRACSAPSGYVADTTDCDDASAARSPAASEVCDSTDNDCDSAVDEASAIDAPTWYLDVDGDGYGGTASSTRSCLAPAGYSAVSTDCDDATAAVSPAAAETCNGVDDDCDRTADDGVTTTYYRDADADGYGDPSTTSAACSLPSGYVTDATDCDDTSAALNPDTVWYRDGDGDGYGDASSTRVECVAPRSYVSNATDCNDGSTSAYPGRTEACDSMDNDCDGQTDEINAVGCTDYYYDYDGDGFGSAVYASRCYCAATGSYDVTNDDDCYDRNADANPDATDWQTSDRGDGSYDYDCDGYSSKRYTDNYDCTGAVWVCVDSTDGWSSTTDPACGDRGSWYTGCSASVTSCSYSLAYSRTQGCR